MHIAKKELFDLTPTPKIAQYSPKMLKQNNKKVREQKNLQNESE